MGRFTVDRSVQERLKDIVDPVELQDEDGQFLGSFLPARCRIKLSDYERAKSLFDPVEIKQIFEAQKGTGVPLNEVLARLNSLENPK